MIIGLGWKERFQGRDAQKQQKHTSQHSSMSRRQEAWSGNNAVTITCTSHEKKAQRPRERKSESEEQPGRPRESTDTALTQHGNNTATAIQQRNQNGTLARSTGCNRTPPGEHHDGQDLEDCGPAKGFSKAPMSQVIVNIGREPGCQSMCGSLLDHYTVR